MASITIKYAAPEAPVEANVDQICAFFLPTNSYVDTEVYEGSIWDTNVEGWGTWEGFVAHLEKISAAPNVLILFKAAARDGEITFEESDPKQVEYIKEIARQLAVYGFEIPEDGAADGEIVEDGGLAA